MERVDGWKRGRAWASYRRWQRLRLNLETLAIAACHTQCVNELRGLCGVAAFVPSFQATAVSHGRIALAASTHGPRQPFDGVTGKRVTRIGTEQLEEDTETMPAGGNVEGNALQHAQFTQLTVLRRRRLPRKERSRSRASNERIGWFHNHGTRWFHWSDLSRAPARFVRESRPVIFSHPQTPHAATPPRPASSVQLCHP